MQNHIEFDPEFALLTVSVNPGETIRAESGAMVSMAGVEMETKSGGFFKALKRKILGGESIFQNYFTGGPQGGWVMIAPGTPGSIVTSELQPGRAMYLQSGAYLASTPNVEMNTKFQGAKGLFSGESIFFLKCYTEEAPGTLHFNSYGAIKQIDVQPGQEITVDTGHVVAFDETLDYRVTKAGNMKSAILGGEGLVMIFSGQGRLYTQTRNAQGLANVLAPFIPTSNSGGSSALNIAGDLFG